MSGSLNIIFLSFDVHLQFLWQIEGFHQEDSHLCARDWRIGAVDTCPASAGDAFAGKLFNPTGGPMVCGNITKHGPGG